MSRLRARWPLSLLLAVVGLALAAPAGALAATVPSGFEDALVADVSAPTALAFAPDGRLFVTSREGRLRVLAGASTSTVLDLSGRVCTDWERGLFGVAVDPDVATNGHVYLYYSFKRQGACGSLTSPTPVNRVSRSTLAGGSIDPATELVLVDNIRSPEGNHNGGDLQFGKDGMLYVSIGDGGCDYKDTSRCGALNTAARDMHMLLGKVLRITRTGGVPADNPWAATGGRCALTGSTHPGRHCQETFAWGLRNPFRLAFDPNATGTRFFINDVGQRVWEEVDEAAAGADYGWNTREGRCATNSTSSCGIPPSGMTNPSTPTGTATGACRSRAAPSCRGARSGPGPPTRGPTCTATTGADGSSGSPAARAGRGRRARS